MGKSTISMAIFNSYVRVYQRINHKNKHETTILIGFSIWFSYGFPMVVLWLSYGFPMVFLWCLIVMVPLPEQGGSSRPPWHIIGSIADGQRDWRGFHVLANELDQFSLSTPPHTMGILWEYVCLCIYSDYRNMEICM